MEGVDGLLAILNSKPGSIVFVLVALAFWWWYRSYIKGKIEDAGKLSEASRIAANAAQTSANDAKTAVNSAHGDLSKRLDHIAETQSKHYNTLLEVKALAQMTDKNVKDLSDVNSELAKGYFKLKTEVKQINETLVFVKTKK